MTADQAWLSVRSVTDMKDSHVQLFVTPRTVACHAPPSWNSTGKNTGVGSHSLLQGIFSAQGSNPGLLYGKQILYQRSHQGSPRILKLVTYPFSRETSDPEIELGSLPLQADSLPAELSGKPIYNSRNVKIL